MAAAAGEEVPNKRVVLKRYVTGFPSEDDMEVVTATARLAVPPGSTAMVVKNLYVSCDPYMRGRMTKHERPSYVPDFVLGEVIILVQLLGVLVSLEACVQIPRFSDWVPALALQIEACNLCAQLLIGD